MSQEAAWVTARFSTKTGKEVAMWSCCNTWCLQQNSDIRKIKRMVNWKQIGLLWSYIYIKLGTTRHLDFLSRCCWLWMCWLRSCSLQQKLLNPKYFDIKLFDHKTCNNIQQHRGFCRMCCSGLRMCAADADTLESRAYDIKNAWLTKCPGIIMPGTTMPGIIPLWAAWVWKRKCSRLKHHYCKTAKHSACCTCMVNMHCIAIMVVMACQGQNRKMCSKGLQPTKQEAHLSGIGHLSCCLRHLQWE